MTRARRPAPAVELLAAAARQPVAVVPFRHFHPEGDGLGLFADKPDGLGLFADKPDPDLYEPAELARSRFVISHRAERERGIVVALNAFGRWRHGVLVDVGRSQLRVAFVTSADPTRLRDRAERPAHVYLLRSSLPASPTLIEETAMPVRRPKATATPPAEPDVDLPAAVAASTAARADGIAEKIAAETAGPPVADGKKKRTKVGPNGAAVQALLTASEQGAVDATFLPALPIGRVVPSEDNPRDSLPDLEELRDSIAEHGVLEPLVVAEAAGAVERDAAGMVASYDLVFGHRRLAAAAAAGLASVPAVVRNDLVDRRADVARLVENLQRADLNPIEEAKGIQRLVTTGGMQQKDVAAAISRNPGHVSKRLQLLKADPRAQELVAAGSLPVDVAVDLSRLPAAEQTRILDMTTHPDSIAGRVSRRADELKAEAELARVTRQLEKGGLTVLTFTGYPRTSPIDGPEYLERLRADSDGFKVPARHDKLACHVAIVAPSYYLAGQRTADELADDPLSAHYRLACTSPESHAVTDRPARPASARDEADAERDARAAAVDQLLAERWGRVVAALAAKPAKNGPDSLGGRLEHALRVGTFERLVTVEFDERAWATVEALLAGADRPAHGAGAYGETDAAGVRVGLAAITAGGEQLGRFAYAYALAVGYESLVHALRYNWGQAEGIRALAALHLRHMADLSGGGIPADPTEQEIALVGADLEAACVAMELLVAEPEAAEGEPDERPVEDVHLPADDVPPAGQPDPAIAARLDADLRRAELGVTREAEADYGVRIGGGDAYLVPGLKTAKGQCSVCHAQVSILAGGRAGKHRNEAEVCAGVGEPVMTLDQALPAAAGADAAPEVDEVVCPTCNGVGRDSSDGRCRTCRGRGMVTPQLEAV